jgi:acyl-CoA oxidase
MQPILEQHRAKSKICRTKLAHLVYGGPEKYDRTMKAFEVLKSQGVVPHPGINELSRVDIYSHLQKTFARLRQNTTLNLATDEDQLSECILATNYHFPGGVGSVMTTNLIRWMGTTQQAESWIPKIQNHVWVTCYAQTELGGGTDVQNLQTLAVFDPKTQEFVFHSPTISSIKWWPGELGLSSSHAGLMARLISNGKDHGVQAFFVELRDPLTHIPHKGVEIGDIGPKMGYASKDNGYLKFSEYRIAKSCLLSKYIQIDSEGNISKSGNPKQMYTGMMNARAGILSLEIGSLAKACTIAIRYSLFRTQFKDSKGTPIPVFSYQMQKEKLLRELSTLYVMTLARNFANAQIRRNSELAKKEDYSELQNSHIMLCCFKAMYSSWSTRAVSNLIKACGGHGYSHFSGLPNIFLDNFPDQILEGENSVLLLQVARYLLKLYGGVMGDNTTKITGKFAFLLDVEHHISSKPLSLRQPFEVSDFVNPFMRSTCILVRNSANKMVELIQKHGDPKLVWDTMMGNDNQRLGNIYSVQLILESALESYRSLEAGPIKNALAALITLFAINQIEEQNSTLMLTGSLTQDTLEKLIAHKDQLLEDISPDALVLAEGWQIEDIFLNSAIAQQDGNPYENLYRWAREFGTLNKFENQIHPAIIEYQLKVSRFREQKL